MTLPVDQAVTKTVFLFPDTNAFLQCLPLDQVKWDLVGKFDEVELVLTRTIQKEIDSFKGAGNKRRSDKAKAVSSQIRTMLEGPITLRKESPLVRMSFEHALRPDPESKGALDYDRLDDEFVGTVVSFQKANPDADVRLLTHDTGPMASAKTVGLKYEAIPDEWLLQPEADESAKQIKNLKAELLQFKNQEPKFEIRCDQVGSSRFKVELTKFEALKDSEIDALVARLRAKHPLATEFGSPEPLERPVSSRSALSSVIDGAKEVFTPATQEEIADYPRRYEEWIQDCEARLANLWQAMQRQQAWPRLVVEMANAGSRPADDTLVEFDVQGRFLLCPPERMKEDEPEKSKAELGLELARPPRPPQGRWVKKRFAGLGSLMAHARPVIAQRELFSPSFYQPLARDPNAVYFKVGARGVPRDRIEYECDQWRHAQSPHAFELDVWCPLEPGQHDGAVRVGVHAANVTKPPTVILPISILIKSVSCLPEAEAMVDALGGPIEGFRLNI